MNTGMQDAANLGWKLAAVLRRGAPDALLDTYESERRPVGHKVVLLTAALTRLVVVRSRILRGLRRLLASFVVAARPLRRLLIGAISGIGISYVADVDDQRLVGKRAPDVRLARRDGGPARLYEALRTGRFVVIASPRDRAAAADVAGPWAGCVDVVSAPVGARQTMMMVRPDGYVAWATNAKPPARQRELASTLRRWCGDAHPLVER